MSGLIDVVVPAKNAAAFVPTFIKSADANAPEGCRYLVIDDGSTDNTFAQLQRAADTRPFIELIHLDRSGGVAAARNLALARVDAQYLAFFDIDDWIAPGQLAALIAAQRRIGATMIRTDYIRVDGYRRVIDTAPGSARDRVLSGRAEIGDAGGRTLVDYGWLWAGVFDATDPAVAQLRFDERLRTGSDRPWFWALHLADISCAVVGSPGYFYRRKANSGSLTESGDESLLDILPAMQDVVELASASGDPAHHRRAAFTTVKMVSLHLSRRARLTRHLQEELIRRSAALLNRIDQDAFDGATPQLTKPEAELARKLRAAGSRWAA